MDASDSLSSQNGAPSTKYLGVFLNSMTLSQFSLFFEPSLEAEVF
jgi:hypothetical protein